MKMLAAALAFAIAFAATPDAHGVSSVRAQTGGGQLGPDYVRADASDLGAGSYPGATPIPNAAPSTAPAYTWERVPTGGLCVVVFDEDAASWSGASLSPLPGLFFFPDLPMQVTPLMGAPIGGLRYDGPSPLPAGIAYAGDLVADVATPIDPANRMVVIPRCVLPGDPVPPTPPTASEIWQQTPLPGARIHANPPGTRA
jgi:hypothetical protein